MEIQGKVVRLGNMTEGTSARGAWRKQELIIETIEQYPKQVCLLCWGNTIDALATLGEGDVIKAGISIESCEFNGKWYTDVRAFGLGLVSSAPQQAVVEQAALTPTQPAPAPQPTYQQADFFAEQADDLPF
ncbi:MAG: DUF3127 domain-containing protein [Bacteroidaceae bacterium]|nr:DUF3127 domain-containing protein [Bacteroidaceae bacterium]